MAGFLHVLLVHPSFRPPWGDLIYFQFLWEADRTTWLTFGQMPLWNPYHCGGMGELANPHSMGWSPFFLPALTLGAGAGIRIFMLTHFVVAFLGTWTWARSRGLRDPWAAAPAVVFAMSGFFTARAAGHLSFLPFAWVPWMLWCWERAQAELRFAYLLGALVALCVYSGAPYPTTYGVLLIATLTTRDLAIVAARRARGLPAPAPLVPARIALVAAAAFVSIAAFKLFPVIEFFQSHPRATPVGDEALGLRQLVEIFLYRPFTREREGYVFPFDEYRDYVGPLVVGGALVTLARGRARLRDVVLAAWFLALVAGDHGAWSPYALLHHVPGFASQRVPSRFVILVLPFVGLWFGQALADLAAGASRARRYAAAVVLILTFADLATINASMLQDWFTVPPEVRHDTSPPARVGFPQLNDTSETWLTTYLRAPLDGYGFSMCEDFEPNPLPRSAALVTLFPEHVELRPLRSGTARLVAFTPNRLEVAVDLPAPARLHVNQNFYPGWRSDVGEVLDRKGRLAVSLPEGKRTVVLWFWPRAGWLYAVLTLLGLAGLGVALTRRDGVPPARGREHG